MKVMFLIKGVFSITWVNISKRLCCLLMIIPPNSSHESNIFYIVGFVDNCVVFNSDYNCVFFPFLSLKWWKSVVPYPHVGEIFIELLISFRCIMNLECNMFN